MCDTVIQKDRAGIAVVTAVPKPVSTAAEALELLMSVRYETGYQRLAVPKELFDESFFRLSSGLVGEILQKFINYEMKLAIWGDFSGYTSKPLHDFIYESNQGRDIFFTTTQELSLIHILPLFFRHSRRRRQKFVTTSPFLLAAQK